MTAQLYTAITNDTVRLVRDRAAARAARAARDGEVELADCYRRDVARCDEMLRRREIESGRMF